MRIKPLLTFFALTVILVAAACAPVTPVIPRDDTGAGSGTPGSSQGSGDSIPQTGGQTDIEEQVRNQVTQFLSQQFNAAANSIESITLNEVDWPDSCLGMGGPAESCAQVITPGWRVTAVVNGQQYTLRANQDASVVRLDMGGSQGAVTQAPGGAGGDAGAGTGGQGTGTQTPGGAGGDDGTGVGGNQSGSGTGAGGAVTGTQTPGGTGDDGGTGGDQGGTGTGGNQGGAGTGGDQGGAGTGTGTGSAQGGPGDEQELGGDDTRGTGNTAESGLDVGSADAGGGQPDQQGGGVSPSASGSGEVMLFLVRENDNGQSGQRIGTCGDSLVGVPANVQLSQDGDLAGNLRQVYNALFNLDQQNVEQGLTSVFQDSNMRLESVSVSPEGRAVIRLFGDLRIDAQCDPDRVRYQLVQAARQFNGVNNVQIFVNDQPLEDVLPDSASEPDQQQD